MDRTGGPWQRTLPSYCCGGVAGVPALGFDPEVPLLGFDAGFVVVLFFLRAGVAAGLQG